MERKRPPRFHYTLRYGVPVVIVVLILVRVFYPNDANVVTVLYFHLHRARPNSIHAYATIVEHAAQRLSLRGWIFCDEEFEKRHARATLPDLASRCMNR